MSALDAIAGKGSGLSFDLRRKLGYGIGIGSRDISSHENELNLKGALYTNWFKANHIPAISRGIFSLFECFFVNQSKSGADQ
jgi:hypothetical protein